MRSSIRYSVSLGCQIIVVFVAISARASVPGSGEQLIYSDIEHDNTCAGRAAWTENGANVSFGPEAVSFSFTPQNSYSLTSIKLPLYHDPKFGKGHRFEVLIVKSADYHGEVSPSDVRVKGNVLAHEVTNKADGLYGLAHCKLQTLHFSPGAQISANQIYWVVILASPDTYGGWIATKKRGHDQTHESESQTEGQSWSSSQQFLDPATFAVYGVPAGN